MKLRHGAPKLSISIDERIMTDVGWPRYRVQWNRDRKSIRLIGDPNGGFEGFHPPRGPKAGSGVPRRIVVRLPLPADLVEVAGRWPASHEVIADAHALTIRVPSRFWLTKP